MATFKTQFAAEARKARPNEKTIERERRQQDAAVIAFRRMLAEGPASKELDLYTAA